MISKLYCNGHYCTVLKSLQYSLHFHEIFLWSLQEFNNNALTVWSCRPRSHSNSTLWLFVMSYVHLFPVADHCVFARPIGLNTIQSAEFHFFSMFAHSLIKRRPNWLIDVKITSKNNRGKRKQTYYGIIFKWSWSYSSEHINESKVLHNDRSITSVRGKKILEQLSRTRFLTEFEFRALFFGAT